MSDEKKTSPSADDIVNKLAQNLGADSDGSTSPQASSKGNDIMAGLGGIFDVAGKDKSTPAAPAPPTPPTPPENITPVDPAHEPTQIASMDKVLEQDKGATGPEETTNVTARTEVSKKKKNELSAINALDGVFKPSSSDDPIELSSLTSSDDLYDDDMPIKQKNPLVPVLIGVVVAFVAVIFGGLYAFTDVLDDVGRVIRGDYREYKLAEKLRIEEEHRQAQLAGMERYGRLMITGEPLYANIKVNGQTQYGETPSQLWTELRVGVSTMIQDLKLSETYSVEISAPGFLTETYTISEGMWQKSPAGVDYQYTLTANLRPETPKHFEEYGARMEPDIENEYYGEISVTTKPEGARVIVNNRVALDKKGEELRTPITFSEYWTRDEDSKTLESHQPRVDTPFDRGLKLEVEVPDNEDYKRYVTQVERRMWDCDWKDDAAIKRLPRNATLQQQCNYKFGLDLDFGGIHSYLEAQEAERQAVLEANKEINAADDEESGEQG